MKSQRLIDALGQIDERLVLDVIPTPVQKKKPRWPAVLSAAAMIGLCIFGASRLKLPSPGQAQPKTEKPTVDVVYEVDPADSVQEALPMLSLGTDYLGDSAEIAYVSDRGQLLDLGIQDFSQLPETLPVYQNLYAENELRQREGWEPDYAAWTEVLQALIEQLGLEGTTEIDELHGQIRFYGSDDEVISVDSQQNIVLYNAVDLTLDETVDESSAAAMEEAGRYLLQNYDFGFSDPVSTVCSYSQNFSAYLYDGAGSLADQLLSLSFRGIQCYFSQGRLYMLSIRNTQLGELVGNYPILNPEEAEQLLRQGAGLNMVPASSTDFEIGAMGLVYLNQPWLDYYLPFYWFRVALPENSPYQTADENHAYTLYYLPAVEPAYISDLPHWELTADPAEAIGEQLAGAAEFVIHADSLHGSGQLFTEQRADSLTQTADDGMLFAGDDLAALLCSGQDQLFIQGLDGGHVDDHGIHTLGSQSISSLHGLVNHQTIGNDGDVLAVPENVALADDKGSTFFVEDGHSRAAHTHINRTVMLIGGLGHGLGLHVIGGGHDDHAGDGAHQGEVLAALMAGTVLAHGDTAVGGADLHIQVGVANGVADLLVGTGRGEHGEGRSKGNQAGGAQACGHTHHVGLGNAAVKEPVGECLAEDTGLGGTGQVSIQDNDIVVLSAQLSQSCAVAFAGSDLFHVCHIINPPVLPA